MKVDYIYGIHPVREGLRGKRQPLELFVDEKGSSQRVDELLSLAREREVPVRQRKRQDLDRLAGQPHHQGAVLSMEPFPYTEIEDLLAGWQDSGETGFFLLLDGITDPHNLGAILRNADAAGCQGVVMTKDRSCGITNVVDKASAGAAEHLAVCQVTNLARCMELLKKNGFWIYGLAAGEDAQPLFTTSLSGNLALVIGSEGGGLRHRTRELCDGLLEIPMIGGVASLNAASASAVALFEVVRQKATQEKSAS
ncbi:MAG: 23S rRNA (guanosine(2251)-2'-O)-methyltransferase RlmB [Desulfuromonadales bacterium]|nr:23S rRNA (guanosine(2251)-2'-O)-methyltransferase RlmB [Desulfuromonadales bacterium]